MTDNPLLYKSHRRWAGIFSAALLLSLVAEFFVHPHHPGPGFGFHAWFGLAAGGGLLVAAKLAGLILKRPENYYSHDDAV